MSDWRPFEPSREAANAAAIYAIGLTEPRTCNRHRDCDVADVKARESGRLYAEHCHDDCCEECFGS